MERRENWRRTHPHYVTLARVQQAIEEEKRRCAAWEALPAGQEVGGLRRNMRHKGWWSKPSVIDGLGKGK